MLGGHLFAVRPCWPLCWGGHLLAVRPHWPPCWGGYLLAVSRCWPPCYGGHLLCFPIAGHCVGAAMYLLSALAGRHVGWPLTYRWPMLGRPFYTLRSPSLCAVLGLPFIRSPPSLAAVLGWPFYTLRPPSLGAMLWRSFTRSPPLLAAVLGRPFTAERRDGS